MNIKIEQINNWFLLLTDPGYFDYWELNRRIFVPTKLDAIKQAKEFIIKIAKEEFKRLKEKTK